MRHKKHAEAFFDPEAGFVSLQIAEVEESSWILLIPDILLKVSDSATSPNPKRENASS